MGRIARDVAVADDLVQDCCVRILENRDRYTEQGRMGQWMRTVARNHTRSALRKQRRMAEHTAATTPVCASEPTGAGTRWDQRYEDIEWMLKELARLPPAQREIVGLKFVDDLDNHEIAARLGVAKQTVSTQLQRALASLRQRAPQRSVLAGLIPLIDAKKITGLTLMNSTKTAAVALTSLAVGATLHSAWVEAAAATPHQVAFAAPATDAAVDAPRPAVAPSDDALARAKHRSRRWQDEARRLREERDAAHEQLDALHEVAGQHGLSDHPTVERIQTRETRVRVAQATLVDESSELDEILQAHADLRKAPDAYTPEMIEILRDIGETHEDPSVRADVWRNFDGTTEVPELVPALLEAMDDAAEGPRSEAVETLGRYADDLDVLEAIRRAAEHDASEAVRAKAARTLRRYEQARRRAAATNAAP